MFLSLIIKPIDKMPKNDFEKGVHAENDRNSSGSFADAFNNVVFSETLGQTSNGCFPAGRSFGLNKLPV